MFANISEEETAERRDFLKRVAAGIGGLALVDAAQPAVCHAEVRYPIPEYLPVDYVLSAVYVDRKDGFLGGPTELARFYRNQKHPEAYTYPLITFMAPDPGRPYLFINQGYAGTPLQLQKGPQVMEATYTDGIWMGSGPSTNRQRSRQTGNVHSLTFQLGDLRIGIVGCRLTGCSQEDLIRVAESLK